MKIFLIIKTILEKINGILMANFLERYKRFLELFIIIFCIFFIKENVFSATMNFDSYANGYAIVNDTANWYNGGYTNTLVSNSYYVSSPNSLHMYNINGFSHAILYATSSQYLSFNYLNKNNSNSWTNGGDQVWFWPYAGVNITFFKFEINYDNATGPVRMCMYIGTVQQLCTYFSNKLSIGTWYNVKIGKNANNLITATINNETKTLQATTTLTWDKVNFYGWDRAAHHAYIDDIITSPYQQTDNINLVYPAEAQILSLKDFFWEYSFNIASTSYATLYDYLDVVVVYNKMVGSPPVSVSTTTAILEHLPMDTINPYDEYVFSNYNNATFPSDLGAYLGVIGLYGDNTLLAYDSFTLGIATTTPPTNTGWCADLCLDIATSTDLLGQISNGVNCAFRSATCYLFSPHTYNLDQFNTQYQNFQTVFPFNTFYDIASTTKNAFASSTINQNQTFGLPNIRKVGTTTQYYIQPLLSSSTMSSFIGNSNATLFRTTISYLMYGITTAGIFLIIWL